MAQKIKISQEEVILIVTELEGKYMCAFDIDSNKGNQLSSGSNFGSIQAMKKKQQEEADAKKTQGSNSPFQEDTVSISDEAKLIINSQLGKLGEKGNLVDAASVSKLVEQMRKAQGEVDEKNGVEAQERVKKRAAENEEVVLTDMGEAVGAVRDLKREIAAEVTDDQVDLIKDQIADKQEEIEEAMGDGASGEAKLEMLQQEMAMLQGILLGMMKEKE